MGNASPFQPEPEGADQAYYDRQLAMARLIHDRRAN